MLSDIYYTIKHTFQKNKGICPKCGYNAFEHGFHPEERYFCSKCGLWHEAEKRRYKSVDSNSN